MFVSRTLMIAGLFYCLALVVPAVAACVIEPEMVRIPAGQFTIGSSPRETGHEKDEAETSVDVPSFAMGKYAVTFAEYDCFFKAVGGKKPDDEGWGRGKRPVINVSWFEATAYAEWLSKQTGRHYRLPTEAEWEYAARAGTETAYYWGNQASHEYANYGAEECCSGLAKGKDQWVNTAPVGSFAPNPWGLYDMLGNVYQWTCSVYDAGYNGGEKVCASNNDAKSRRSYRGGSWGGVPLWLRAAIRDWSDPGDRGDFVGFRLVQD